MNEIFAGASAFALALILWGLGKKPKISLLEKAKPQFTQVKSLVFPSLVEPLKKSSFSIPITNKKGVDLPKSPQEKIDLRKEIHKLMSLGPEERLKAVQLADLWGSRIVVPILLKGLRDSDSRIVKASANALMKHKGMPSLQKLQEETSRRPPRNVALTR